MENNPIRDDSRGSGVEGGGGVSCCLKKLSPPGMPLPGDGIVHSLSLGSTVDVRLLTFTD